jgi:hypothetical protein
MPQRCKRPVFVNLNTYFLTDGNIQSIIESASNILGEELKRVDIVRYNANEL